MNFEIKVARWIVFAGTFLTGGTALGLESTCATSSDCGRGYVCEVVAASACGGVACPSGEPCPEPEPCEPEEFRGCVPGPCVIDADCAQGMVCLEYTTFECTDVACSAGVECPVPEPSDCTERSESTCVPPYVPPCEVDADCGTGFDCVEDQRCECSGGGSVGPGEPPEPTEPECTCTPAGTFHCQMRSIECSADGDCPTEWTCVEMGASGGCAEPVPGTAGASSSFSCDAGPIESQLQCMPRFYDVMLPGGSGADYAQGEVTRDEGGPGSVTAPGGAGGSGGASASGGDESSSGCSCRTKGSAPGGGPVALLLSALALFAVRRARRAAS